MNADYLRLILSLIRSNAVDYEALICARLRDIVLRWTRLVISLFIIVTQICLHDTTKSIKFFDETFSGKVKIYWIYYISLLKDSETKF